MRRSIGDVVERLTAEGLAPAGLEETARAEMAKEFADHIPSYLRAAVAAAAFLSTGFLLGFFFAIAGLRDPIARLVVGILLMVASGWLRRAESVSEFVRWSTIAAALAGMGLVVVSVAELADDAISASIACLVCSLGLIWFIRDFVLRFLAALAGGTAVIVAVEWMRDGQGLELGVVIIVAAAAWVWRVDLAKRGDALAEMLEPVGYALLVVLFGSLITRTVLGMSQSRIFGPETRTIGEGGPLVGIALTIALVVLVWRILDELDVPLSAPTAVAALFGAAALGMGALNSPGIIAGTAVLMLGFDRRSAQLIGLAVLFLLVFLSFYYYNLELTLLQKAGVLVGSGLLLIGIRQRIARSE